jgi:hypothetical protein
MVGDLLMLGNGFATLIPSRRIDGGSACASYVAHDFMIGEDEG